MSALKVKYRPDNPDPITRRIEPDFQVQNKSGGGINLHDVALEYFYSSDGAAGEQAVLRYATLKPGKVDITGMVTLEIARLPGCVNDRVLRVGFTDGAGIYKKEAVFDIGVTITRAGGAYNQLNDYSFNSRDNGWIWIPFKKVVALIGGSIVWGIEPECTLMAAVFGRTDIKQVRADRLDGANVWNYPNPCSSQTMIRFSLDKQQNVSISIYDMAGKLGWKTELAAGDTMAGINTVEWDLTSVSGQKFPNGTYLCRIQAGERTVVKKIAIAR